MQDHYRHVLRTQLEERIKKNPRYSLRSFAKSLDLAAPRLSCILARKQGMSEAVASRVCQKLGLNPKESTLFITSVIASDARSKAKRKVAEKTLLELHETGPKKELDEERFKIISDWQHFAILELIQTKGFQNDADWISKRLGISKFEVTQSLQRLESFGFIAFDKQHIKITANSLTTTNDVPSQSIRKFNQQILEKASAAVSEQTVDERDFSTLTFGYRKADLPKVKEMIKKFRRELNQYAESINPNQRDEVYIFSANLFKLSKEIK